MTRNPRPTESFVMLARRFHLWTAAAAAIGIIPYSHAAARTYSAQDIGGWTVAASKGGGGCFLSRDYDRPGQTTLLLGLDTDGTNRLSILNANWSIRPKERLELTFRLSRNSFPKHFAIGIASDGKQGFVTTFNSKFPAHFAASRSLDVFRGDVPVEKLSLVGSGAAVAELRKCVDAQPVESATKADPTPSSSIPIDPFAPTQKRNRKK